MAKREKVFAFHVLFQLVVSVIPLNKLLNKIVERKEHKFRDFFRGFGEASWKLSGLSHTESTKKMAMCICNDITYDQA